jgi:hypothetical protein
MTEAEWLACEDPERMLEFLRGRVSERKQRLFGCAVCRLVWRLFTDERSRMAVEVVERYADGLASREAMAEAEALASDARDLAVGPSSTAPRRHRSRAGMCTSWAAYCLTLVPDGDDRRRWVGEVIAEATAYVLDARKNRRREGHSLGVNLLRCVLGNPFHPVQPGPWVTPAAVTVARDIYDRRDFAALPLLADLLEEAGCPEQSLLDHLRSAGPHARGCWAVDLVLGKS